MKSAPVKALVTARGQATTRTRKRSRRIKRADRALMLLLVMATILALGVWCLADLYLHDAVLSAVVAGLALVSFAPRMAVGLAQGYGRESGR